MANVWVTFLHRGAYRRRNCIDMAEAASQVWEFIGTPEITEIHVDGVPLSALSEDWMRLAWTGGK